MVCQAVDVEVEEFRRRGRWGCSLFDEEGRGLWHAWQIGFEVGSSLERGAERFRLVDGEEVWRSCWLRRSEVRMLSAVSQTDLLLMNWRRGIFSWYS